ncbi:MAG TPA: hypothetical protein PKJ41_00020 [Bryobacteraceae bacterium]|nr:hypothetical protein [Bryobacteraceae bacterium]
MPVVESPQPICRIQPRGGIDPVVSERIAMVRFPLIIGVVLVHIDWRLDALGNHMLPAWQNFIVMLLYDVLPRSAVPLFTFLAGYLYFQNFMGRMGDYLTKNSVRVRTLLMPYVIWNALALLMMLALHARHGMSDVLGRAFPSGIPQGLIEAFGFSGGAQHSNSGLFAI